MNKGKLIEIHYNYDEYFFNVGELIEDLEDRLIYKSYDKHGIYGGIHIDNKRYIASIEEYTEYLREIEELIKNPQIRSNINPKIEATTDLEKLFLFIKEEGLFVSVCLSDLEQFQVGQGKKLGLSQ